MISREFRLDILVSLTMPIPSHGVLNTCVISRSTMEDNFATESNSSQEDGRDSIYHIQHATVYLQQSNLATDPGGRGHTIQRVVMVICVLYVKLSR
ncbi:hypothetical protein JTE90_011756 [Oedothorax gibbosus]|uniref:Uncharacterized protein n=1 Tax=Oedothorax gibbosus TaxID=931172 RepID=A0AAV6VSR8_9ARAC|nr:hypothetical protein JTE90_011756 [Oedothorax gibbosus]